MKPAAVLVLLLVLLLSFAGSAGLAAQPPAAPAPSETLTWGRFGTVTLYRSSPHPSRVALFLSGDGGWNRGVVEMAKILAGMDTLVAGISVPHYLKEIAAGQEKCTYAAADLEMLSKTVQKKLGYPSYVPPVVVGYSSGATLAFAALAQAPPGTFAGAISMGFCPDLPLHKPFCAGHGLAAEPGPKGKGFVFQPVKAFESPWVAFQGEADKVCDPDLTRHYTQGIRGAEAVLLPDVGHGFGKLARWVPQFRQAYLRLVRDKPRSEAAPAAGGTAGGAAEVKDLPLVEVPAREGTGGPGDAMAVVLSGDGGWAGLDREVAGALSERGTPVVGLNSLQYFWSARDPEGASRDLARILRHYLEVWKRHEALLVGYSQGADVLPFLVSRLPAGLRERVGLVALLGPSRTASFEFHLSDWLGGSDTGKPVLPEVKKLAGLSLLCVYGKSEDDSLCPEIVPSLGKTVELAGGHHFGGGYRAVADLILREAKAQAGKLPGGRPDATP